MSRPARVEPALLVRHERALALAIVALAFVVRVVYVLQIRSSPFFDAPEMDPLVHLEWARAFARGERFWDGPFFRAPLYPWFLGLQLRLFGDGLLVPRLVQAGLGAATCGLVYLCGRRAFDGRVGLLAALFAALSWVLVYFDGELLLETLGVPLTMLALWLTLRLEDDARRGPALGAGLAWGLSAITRPTVLAFLPFLVLWRLAARRPDWRRGALEALWLVVGTALPILPVTTANVVAGDDFVLVSSQGGVNFYIGNNPQSDGSTAIVPGTRPDWWGGYRDAIAQAEAEVGRELEASEVSRHYARKAWTFLLGDPARSVPLLLFKLRLYWTNHELGNNQEPAFMARRFGPITRLLPLGFWFAAPLGLLGMLLARRGRRARFPLWGFVLVYSAVVVLFFVNARFRVPVVPVLLVHAAYTVVWVVDRVRDGQLGRVLLAVLAVLFGIVACIVGVPPQVASSEANGLFLLGYAAERDGDSATAAGHFQRALELRPASAITHRELGKSFKNLGRPDEARRHLLESLRLDPADFTAASLLVDLDLAQGDFAAATRRAERVAAAAPHDPKAWYDVARCHLRVGRFEDARAPLERALERDPDYFYALWSAGILEQHLGRPERAAELLGRATSVATAAPAEHVVQAYALRIEVLERLGREEEARAALAEARARFDDTESGALSSPMR